jgi:hypothetical protein
MSDKIVEPRSICPILIGLRTNQQLETRFVLVVQQTRNTHSPKGENDEQPKKIGCHTLLDILSGGYRFSRGNKWTAVQLGSRHNTGAPVCHRSGN